MSLVRRELRPQEWAAAVDLLTETAEGFFRRRGFELVGRDAVPSDVQASAEFQGLCPVSARVLVR